MGFRVSVSLHPAIRATGRLALAPAELAPAGCICLSWTRDHLIRPRQHRGGDGEAEPLCGSGGRSRTRPLAFRPYRQGEGERGPLAHLALDPDLSPVQLHELLGQRQAQPRALLLAGIIAPDLAELLEDGRL